MIRGVVFDLGNTLMYFDGDWERIERSGAAAMVDYLNAQGYAVPPEFGGAFIALRHAGRLRSTQSNVEYTAEQALADMLAQYNMGPASDAILRRAVEIFFVPEEGCWTAYADAAETLRTLHAQNLKLALLSNATDHDFIERIARNGGVAEFLDPLLSSAKISHRKPDPRAFQPILDAWRFAPHEIVMVGDAASFDILGAHRAGMRGILIAERWDTPPPPHAEFDDANLMVPDATIRQIAELPLLLQQWNHEE